MNEAARHRCVIHLSVDVHELDKVGQCTTLVPNSKLTEYGIVRKKLYKLDGETLHECLTKLKSVLDKLS